MEPVSDVSNPSSHLNAPPEPAGPLNASTARTRTVPVGEAPVTE